MPTARSTIGTGDVLVERELRAITGEPVRLPDPARLTHLQFRRYATCPLCNLHLRSITQRHNEILAAGIREVVVFHSPADFLLATDNRVLARKYGSHAYDQWAVDELLHLAR